MRRAILLPFLNVLICIFCLECIKSSFAKMPNTAIGSYFLPFQSLIMLLYFCTVKFSWTMFILASLNCKSWAQLNWHMSSLVYWGIRIVSRQLQFHFLDWFSSSGDGIFSYKMHYCRHINPIRFMLTQGECKLVIKGCYAFYL